MDLQDKLSKIQNYGLTTSVGVYGEDQYSARRLNIVNSNKIRECLLVLDYLTSEIESLKVAFDVQYEGSQEELDFIFNTKVEHVKQSVNKLYFSVFHENSMSPIELNGEISKLINECLEIVNNLVDNLKDINGAITTDYNESNEMLSIYYEALIKVISESVTAIKEQVDASYVYVYNEDAMNNLELAGCTAKSINECLKAINMLYDLVKEIKNSVIVDYTINEEMLKIGE